jgi:hypothetical protein
VDLSDWVTLVLSNFEVVAVVGCYSAQQLTNVKISSTPQWKPEVSHSLMLKSPGTWHCKLDDFF